MPGSRQELLRGIAIPVVKGADLRVLVPPQHGLPQRTYCATFPHHLTLLPLMLNPKADAEPHVFRHQFSGFFGDRSRLLTALSLSSWATEREGSILVGRWPW